jgi:hypothetical protein
MNKAGVILEIIWFVMGGLFLFIGITTTIDSGIGESWYFLVFALLALVMYLRRRKIRISGN